MRVRNSNRGNIKWERWADEQGRKALLIPSVSSLSLSLSYVTHMIHVEPRGAGIALTFCIQHTHTHTLSTNANKNVSLNPQPTCSGYCTCLFAQSCLYYWLTHCAYLWMLCIVIVELKYASKTYIQYWPSSQLLVHYTGKHVHLKNSFQYSWCTCAFKTASQLLEKDTEFSRLHHKA